MKIFGISLTTLFVLVGFFWLGTKFPNTFGNLPVIGK